MHRGGKFTFLVRWGFDKPLLRFQGCHRKKNVAQKNLIIWYLQIDALPTQKLELTYTHSQMEHYFFSYLLTWEVDIIEFLEIMAQMW